MAVPTAGAMLEALAQRKARLEDELREVEKQVYNLETSYLNDSSTHGNVLKGFEGFLGPAKTQKCAAFARVFGATRFAASGG
jgi:chromatin modification-related protein EAF6